MADIWERLPDEPIKAWTAFVTYRDMGLSRTYVRTCEALNRPASYRKPIEKWASRFNWQERVRAYDAHIDRLNRNFHESEKRSEYARKVEAYRDEMEKLSAAMVAMGARAIAILQRELASRLQHPERLKPSELAGLMRASIWAVDVGSKLQAEALGLDNLAHLLTETTNQRN
ncbi:MAG: hypothetical protein C6Y22_08310 [Hapalosiphonaceae cyanobacterium JJU2]|nr:MAG: hypothetical protein C6Y22_08310 [Hapalosiphonaceae cyanobacterium JJU2]